MSPNCHIYYGNDSFPYFHLFGIPNTTVDNFDPLMSTYLRRSTRKFGFVRFKLFQLFSCHPSAFFLRLSEGFAAKQIKSVEHKHSLNASFVSLPTNSVDKIKEEMAEKIRLVRLGAR